MVNAHFRIDSSNDDITPAAFGYWSVRWSDKLAHSFLEGIKDDKFEGSTSYLQSFVTYLQFVALFSAAHWVYAIYILGVTDQHVPQMQAGFDDSIKEFVDPDGTPFTENLIEVFGVSFRRYFKAISDDLNSDEVDTGAFNPDISNSTKMFIEAVEHYNFSGETSMEEIERVRFGHMVADIPLSIFTSLKEQGLIFRS